jgi:superfamily II DNA or RNA helicase
MTLTKFNENVKRIRRVLQQRGIELSSSQLEYEVARLVARYEFPPEVDIVEVLNEVADSIDPELSLGENLEIARAVIERYVSPEERLSYKDVEDMIRALEEWYKSQAEEYIREHYKQGQEGVVEWWQIFSVPPGFSVSIEPYLEQVQQPAEEVVERRTVELRPYQEEALNAWNQAGRRGVVVLPTGTGKTYVALRVMLDELMANPQARVAVIVPYIALAQQWREKMRKVIGLNPGLYYGEEKRLRRVTIFVLNSAYLNPRLLRLFNLVIIDEVHHLKGEKFQRIIHEVKDKAVLGLTATPELRDLQYYVPIIYNMSLAKAREKRAVVDIEIVSIYVDMTPEERREYMDIEKKMENVAKLIERLRTSERPEDKAELEELETRYRILAGKRKRLMSRIEEKRRRSVEIARSHAGERVIVFMESIESAEMMKRELVASGIKAETYHSQKSDADRRRILAAWGKAFSVLVTVRALDEGIDVPEVSVAIIVASGTSTRQITQRLGRILRPAPGKEAARLYVLVARNTYEAEILSRIREIAGKSGSPQGR